MAIEIEFRNGTASLWASTNPILSQGEVGVEYGTGQFKIGDGITVWNSLLYQGQSGPTEIYGYRSLGDGSDGNVTISSGVTALTRDMYYNNLIINGTGQLATNAFKVFVKGTLDLTAAPVGAINANGGNGGNASGSTGGSAPATVAAGTVGAYSNGGAGANGTSGNGTNGGGATGAVSGNGGGSNGSGNGGIGNGTTAGSGAGGISPNPFFINRWETNLLKGVSLLGGGVGVGGGGSGGGDGSSASGGGGGGGGSGGGALLLYANIILTSSSTSASCIQAIGGNGGNGGDGQNTGGATGGGGGGGSGCGGWIFVLYNQRVGPMIANMLDSSSGTGGAGGAGFNAGVVGASTGGRGGSGGNAGTIQTYQIQTAASYFYTAVNITSWTPQVTGSVFVGTIGGGGGFFQSWRLNF